MTREAFVQRIDELLTEYKKDNKPRFKPGQLVKVVDSDEPWVVSEVGDVNMDGYYVYECFCFYDHNNFLYPDECDIDFYME